MGAGAGLISVENTTIQGQGDDGFNIHGGFITVVKQLTPTSVEYIDERGAGWIEAAPSYMVGDAVEFYSRRTLQPLGTSTIVSANLTAVAFADKLPAAFKRFDMFHSLKRVASLHMCVHAQSSLRGCGRPSHPVATACSIAGCLLVRFEVCVCVCRERTCSCSCS
jgi:hypothetical protein